MPKSRKQKKAYITQRRYTEVRSSVSCRVCQHWSLNVQTKQKRYMYSLSLSISFPSLICILANVQTATAKIITLLIHLTWTKQNSYFENSVIWSIFCAARQLSAIFTIGTIIRCICMRYSLFFVISTAHVNILLQTSQFATVYYIACTFKCAPNVDTQEQWRLKQQ